MSDKRPMRTRDAHPDLPLNGLLRDAIVSAFNLACSLYLQSEEGDIDWTYNEDMGCWEILGSSVPPEVCAAFVMSHEGEA